MSESNSTLEYLWLCLREPCLLTLSNIISSKAEGRYLESLNTLQHSLRGTVIRFLRSQLDYYRDDNLPDLYCRDAWPTFCELYKIIVNAQSVGSPTLIWDTRSYLFYAKIGETRPELFETLSKIGQKYLSYTKQFREQDGDAMYNIRRQTHHLGTVCGRIFGFFPYTFRAEKITYNEKKDYNKRLRWLDAYVQWLRSENCGYMEDVVIPNCERLAICGFRGMTDIEDYGDGDYYGEFSYTPSWDRRKMRGTRGVNAWFSYHTKKEQREGILYTTESVNRKKDLCCFWPVSVEDDAPWADEKSICLADDYVANVESIPDDIWSEPGFVELTNRERIAVLELALTKTDTLPWVYYHLANEYRELNEPWIFGDLVRRLYCWPRALSRDMPSELFERIEDEYYDEISEYQS